MNKINDTVLGIDIGGSHITAALVSLSEKSIISNSYRRSAVNSWGAADPVVNFWVDEIKSVQRKMGTVKLRLGIALPGPFDYENGISYMKGNSKYDSLYGLNIKNLLSERLQIQANEIRMLNDAAAFLKGEVFAGAGQNFQRCIGLTLGTGLGTAVYINGLAKDVNLWNSKFKNGIAEDYISNRWCVKRYFELTGINILDVKTLTEIARQSPVAKTIFKEYGENLAEFLIAFIKDVEPEVVIMGGNITQAESYFLPSVRKILLNNNIHVPLKITKLGERSALFGAAYCWDNQ